MRRTPKQQALEKFCEWGENLQRQIGTRAALIYGSSGRVFRFVRYGKPEVGEVILYSDGMRLITGELDGEHIILEEIE